MSAVSVAAMLLTGCGSEIDGGSDMEPAGSWEQLPDAPLSPRERAVAVAVDDRVLVVGGSDAAPCPPLADCAALDEPALSDGAVFDPAIDQWRSIAEAPLPIDRSEAVVIGSSVYLWVSDTRRPDSRTVFLKYDVEADEWTELPKPPGVPADGCCDLVAAGDRIVAYPGSHEFGESPDHIFDPSTGEWSELPSNPLSPTFDRVMVWTGTELVHFGSPIQESPERDGEWYGLAAVLDMDSEEWHRLPDTGGHIVDTRAISGQIVNPWLGAPGDGDDLYGWTYDVSSGPSPLPDPPSETESAVSSIGVIGGGEGYFAEDYGWVLDVDTAEWLWVEARPGADRGDHEGPFVGGVSTAAVGESMFAYGGVRWDGADSDHEWLGEVWLWRP